MKKVIFNKISVIQSLSDSELHTGKKVKDDIDLYNLAFDRGLTIELLDAKNKNEFTCILKSLTEQAQNNGSFPVLHIEAHGSSDHKGIILKSNEFLSWTDLKPYFISLNTATKMNLLLVFSLCHGAHFTRHLNPSDRAPCWGLVGPTKAISGSDLLRSFSAFYREVFESAEAGTAVSRLNEYASENDIDYYFTTSTTFFINVYKNYLEKHCTEKAYDKRARSMRKHLKKSKSQKLPSIGEIRRKLKSTQKEFFENYRINYFLIDLFPENENRFEVSYREVMK